MVYGCRSVVVGQSTVDGGGWTVDDRWTAVDIGRFSSFLQLPIDSSYLSPFGSSRPPFALCPILFFTWKLLVELLKISGEW
ncbi:hypothetical protein AKJ16_DCAP02823 [Drosera capensis]